MKILFATNLAHIPQRVGGSVFTTHELALQFTAAGHKVGVVCSLSSGDTVWVKNRLISKLFRRKCPADQIFPYRVFRGYNVSEGLIEVLRNFKPDLMIAQAWHPIPLTMVSLQEGVRTLLYLHDVEFSTLGGDIPKDENLRIVANSNFTANAFQRLSGLLPPVVPPLVRRHAYFTPTSRQRVVFVNTVPVKGLEVAIALARLNPDIPFDFLEGWPLSAEQIVALEKRLLEIPNVRFHRNMLDMRKAYANAKIVLIPSQLEEAWGRVATEAQYSGIPCLASRIGGLPEAVGPGGYLIDPRANIEEWDKHLKKLWFDHDIYDTMSKAAFSYSTRDQLNPSRVIEEIRRISFDPPENR